MRTENLASGQLQASSESRLRQLCSIGVGGPVIAPTLLGQLHRITPHVTNVVFHRAAGERVGLFQASFGTPDPVVRPEVREALTAEGIADKDWIWVRSDQDVFGSAQRVEGRWPAKPAPRPGRDGAASEAGLRSVRLVPRLHVQVRDGTGFIGLISLVDPDQSRTAASDLATLQRLEPLITKALTPREVAGVAEIENGGNAMLVVDLRGIPRWASAGARCLLSLAFGSFDAPLPAVALRALLPPNHDGAKPAAVTWSMSNRWGRFEFRAHRLESGAGLEPLTGINVTRLVPMPVKLFEALGSLDFAPRQSEVALQLALGKTQDCIADALGMTRATVIYHRRQIYNRLGVDAREQLVERLLRPSRSDDVCAAKPPIPWGGERASAFL